MNDEVVAFVIRYSLFDVLYLYFQFILLTNKYTHKHHLQSL